MFILKMWKSSKKVKNGKNNSNLATVRNKPYCTNCTCYYLVLFLTSHWLLPMVDCSCLHPRPFV